MTKFILTASVFLASVLHAEDKLDQHSQEALKKTQELLNSSQQRQEAINSDPQAKKADDFVKNLTGNSNASSEIYELAAEVFASVVKDAQGDPAKMQEAISKFSRDPASFANQWTPEQKQKLKELSGKLPQPILKD